MRYVDVGNQVIVNGDIQWGSCGTVRDIVSEFCLGGIEDECCKASWQS